MDFENQNHINFGQNQNFDQLKQEHNQIKPNFTKTQLDSVELPDWVAKDIRQEKYRIFFLSLVSGVLFLISLFFVLAYFIPTATTSKTTGETTKWSIPTNWIPHPAFTIIICVLTALVFTLAIVHYIHLINSVKSYKGDLLMNNNTMPYFIIQDYRSLVARVVYTNWICCSIYLVTGITIGVFWILKAAHVNHGNSFNTELIILYVILGVTFAIHMISLIAIKLRKGNLCAHANGSIVSLEDEKLISKSANKKCLVIFLVVAAILLFAIFIPYVIIRKSQGKKIFSNK
ncbi:MSC_0882 family membrane protein [Mesoplasma lactucae]|uniref:Uncharacterized protein n=1 Tax=Mesoplasma lactucae ATCC 49193 TaxID=81460 RepID=A0A291IRE4_9MOLU|nr:hypothetical protein [Mesoplasma lactucae]ATG97330.1 hypothetical protein CP520_00975 [Mesoplasma lactucae ATCC 49193]ATZ20219.1 hypothetical protein MLACT_v1c03980 [Mesoplasma lactucae ATCC 49193]MCL8216968.1 hypothetical protein [Mesoplasma lactucae ATCC 49193]